jgi:hypothetical protein
MAYWEAGDKVTPASSIPTEKFSGGSLGKLGAWLHTDELNKDCVGGGGGKAPALACGNQSAAGLLGRRARQLVGRLGWSASEGSPALQAAARRA